MIELVGYKKTMSLNGEKKEKVFVKANLPHRMDFEKLCALIAERTTLTDFEVAFVLAEVEQVVIENIELGRDSAVWNCRSKPMRWIVLRNLIRIWWRKQRLFINLPRELKKL